MNDGHRGGAEQEGATVPPTSFKSKKSRLGVFICLEVRSENDWQTIVNANMCINTYTSQCERREVIVFWCAANIS